MWSLTITNPNSEPVQIKIISGKMTLGRLVTSDIVINDVAASRRHAEIYFDPVTEVIRLNDLKSSNGTYVNRQKISGYFRLQNGDVIRIGQTVMHLARISDAEAVLKDISGTHLFTRDLVLEAVDEHPILLNEITEKLNTVENIDVAISLVVELIKKSMGANTCEVILAREFNKIDLEAIDGLMAKAIRNSSIEVSPQAMCVPVISNDKPLALIHLERTLPGALPFNNRDMQLVVAVSHQTALTLVRIELLEKIRKEGQVRQHLLRFISPMEADDILKDYLKTGVFPDPAEKKVTVLYVGIADALEPPEQVAALKFTTVLNNFYQVACQVAFKKGGIVRYLGNGLLAFFLETKDFPDPEERAVLVARELVEFIRKGSLPEPGDAFVIGVAINTSHALLGYFGSQERAEFNITGNLIRTTCRMQEEALPNRILIGASTADALRNKYLIKKTASLNMGTNEQLVQVYEVSLAKVSPFIQMENDMSAAFKAISQRLKARKG